MNRRTLISALGGTAAVWPSIARAQQTAGTARIGVVSPFSPSGSAVWHEALRGGLADLGWVEGGNLQVDYRFANGDSARLPELVADLLRLNPNLLVTEVTEATFAAKRATSTISIVMVAVGDPVSVGLVQSLARPGGNVTGLSQNIVESAGKRLEMLKQAAPSLVDVLVLANPTDDNSTLNQREVETSARRLGLQVHSIETTSAEALNKALAGEIDVRVRGLFVVPSPLFVVNLKLIAAFALRHRLPSIFHLSEFVRAGGLLAYGPDRNDIFRRTATYVDKILHGAKPAELPVQQPTKFELVINLETAKALGLTIPPTLLVRADEVIE
jgi:putative tryptophan/tyrosine transport system substrate-binding protein